MDVPGRKLLRWASRLVPPTRRDDWLREWEAEVAHAWQSLNRHGRASLRARAHLRVRVLTCVIDALWEKKETMKMTGFTNDVRFALRGLLRRPGFTAVALLTLALGIGASTAVFTLVDSVLLEPLPFPDSQDLVSIQHLGREGRDELPMSTGLYLLYREQASSIEEIGLWAGTVANLVADGEPERIQAQAVTPSLFPVLGVEPVLGRGFTEEEGLPGADPVVILSDGLWRSNFGASPDILGQTLDINGTLREVVGVMPPDFGHPDRTARLWFPLAIDPVQAPLAAFGAEGVARLAPGSNITTLSTDLENLIGRLAELYPESGSPAFLAEVGLRSKVVPLKTAVVGEVSTTLWILLGTVAFVLLIACANVANLLLVRAEGRQREMALRVAVGAGRLQLLRTFMGESLALALAGGALGVGIAVLAVRRTLGLIPTAIPRMDEIAVDLGVLGFTAAVSVVCAVIFGVFPMIRYGIRDLAGQLKEGSGHGATAGPARNRLRSSLVVVQVALALVLLVGSGLMYRSFQALRAVDPGFDVENVLTARVSVPTAEVQGWEETAGFFRQLRERLEAQPGVLSVGMITRAPLNGGLSYTSLEVEDHPRGPDELPVFSSNAQVTPGYFEAMDVPLLEGRTFQPGDGAEEARSVVISESFARHWWPDASPLGRRLRAGINGEDWYNIVGVVGDVSQVSLEEPPEETVYYPVTMGPAEDPFPARTLDVVVKVTADPASFIPVVRREVRALNPRIPLASPQTMESVLSNATARTSFTMALLGVASGIALLLGLVGIYGVISYIVSQRITEIGVRMALGADAAAVRGMVVRQGLVMAAVGVAVGLLAAGGLSTFMASILFGVSAKDPVTYATVAGSLVLVAAAASWLPAHRASRVDPARALRAG